MFQTSYFIFCLTKSVIFFTLIPSKIQISLLTGIPRTYSYGQCSVDSIHVKRSERRSEREAGLPPLQSRAGDGRAGWRAEDDGHDPAPASLRYPIPPGAQVSAPRQELRCR